MRIIIVTALVFLAALAVLAVASVSEPEPLPDRGGRGQRQVVASFYPLAFAASEGGGDRVTVTNLTPPGAEPHDLELSPDAVRKLKAPDVVLLMGRGFQSQVERAAGSGDGVVRLLDSPGLDPRSGDPHVWLDPVRYAVVAERIGRAIGTPGGGARLATRLRALDAAYRAGLAHCERRDLVTTHEAFGYLATRYGLREVPITGISPEAEPAPKDLERTVDDVRRTGATTVFFETLAPRRIAQTVARETGARTAVLDPLEGLTDAERRQGDDYFSVMRRNLESLKTGLGCR
jgi:zinc transport system substrate-binding protein